MLTLPKLGIPTANLPISGLDVGGHKDLENGVYYGFAGLNFTHATDASRAQQPKGASGSENADHRPLGGGNNITHLTAPNSPTPTVFPMVMSIGWNPFYKNEVRSVEVHIIHKFTDDFYNAHMNLLILGFIRHEQDYKDVDALIKDIKEDVVVSEKSLARDAYFKYKDEVYLKNFSWVKPEAN